MDAAAILRNYKIPIFLGGISVLTIIVSIVLLVKSTQTPTPIEFSSDRVEASSSAVLTVDVEGAVASPGVYTLPGGARVEDAIAAAGGLERDADDALFAKTMNRAAKLVDGGKIYIPSLSSSPQSPQSPLSPLVSVNSGSQSELDSLPGVGPVTAQKIIDNRPYQTLDDLVTKKAIGPSLYEKLKNNLSL
ncbi:MAG: ComEA family DNA-binding protein [Candidatus Gottesmanbacteria bacterium]|nr:ComEA family DNA-binding protein [Candidatus Gottesmanbacteria bacterium]